MTSTPRMAIYCGPLNGNSTAKISVRLANGFVAHGTPTDLLVAPTRSPVDEAIDPAVDLVDLGVMNALTRVLRMTAYLRRHRPHAVLTHRIRENVLTLKAARLSGLATPVYVTVHGPMSHKLEHMPPSRGRKRRAEVLRWYPRNRTIVAISEQTAGDLRGMLGAGTPIVRIPNPIVMPGLVDLAAEPAGHPWLMDRTKPLVVFAGRLEAEKDLPTLLDAVALLRREWDCRLLIIGEGRLRAELEARRVALDLVDHVDMPGWAANPYPYLRHADLVVLSSYWDALPTVLIEALALGTPVVSTACGPGPAEILQDGRLGPLVPPRDPAALAAAMAAVLADPLPAEMLREGGRLYDAQRNADLYRALMLAGTPSPGHP